MIDLALHRTNFSTGSSNNDYCVYWTSEKFARQRVGRIYLADGRSPEVWYWFINPSLPSGVPAWCNGISPTLEVAKVDFRRVFQKLAPVISDADWRRCFEHMAAVEERWR